jgi:hypothetical protein
LCGRVFLPALVCVALAGCGSDQHYDSPQAAVKTFLGAIASDDYDSACDALSSAAQRDIARNAGGEDRCPQFLRTQFRLGGRDGNEPYRDAELEVVQQFANMAVVNARIPERKLTLPLRKSGEAWKLELLQR